LYFLGGWGGGRAPPTPNPQSPKKHRIAIVFPKININNYLFYIKIIY
jgi:hypothetical protein